MFLFQKFNYECVFINEQNMDLLNDISDEDVQALKYCGFDTETTGLHHTTSMPFLVTFGYGKKIFAFEPTISLIQEMFKVANRFDRLFAHNAKYDYHMIWNFLGREPVEIEHKIADVKLVLISLVIVSSVTSLNGILKVLHALLINISSLPYFSFILLNIFFISASFVTSACT